MICIVWLEKCLIKGHLNREKGEGSQGATYVDNRGKANAKALRLDHAWEQAE